MNEKEIAEYDVEFTLKDTSFEKTEKIIEKFIKNYKILTFSQDYTEINGIKIMPSVQWGDINNYASLVLDYNHNKFYIRILKPLSNQGINLEDCIKQRDNFADRFIDYMIENNLDIN